LALAILKPFDDPKCMPCHLQSSCSCKSAMASISVAPQPDKQPGSYPSLSFCLSHLTPLDRYYTIYEVD
jgi:hypothetical protein